MILWAILLPVLAECEQRGWLPRYEAPHEISIRNPTVAILTHSSRFFDPLEKTKPAVDRVVKHMKRRGLPVLYFHDKHNEQNPPWKYLYSDGRPTHFVESSAGQFETRFHHVRHVVLLGGYFWCCERQTLNDAVRLWRRDAAATHDLRITQVIDGVFDVTEGVRFNDPYFDRVRGHFFDTLRKQHPRAAISVAATLALIDDEELEIDFLRRQFNMGFPSELDVVIDYFGKRIVVQKATKADEQLVSADKPSENEKSDNSEPGEAEGAARSRTIELASDERATGPNGKQTRTPTLTLAYRTSHNVLVRDFVANWKRDVAADASSRPDSNAGGPSATVRGSRQARVVNDQREP